MDKILMSFILFSVIFNSIQIFKQQDKIWKGIALATVVISTLALLRWRY